MMSLSLEQLTEQAMNLPTESRAMLADKLVESLDVAEPNELQRLWTAEAIKRRDEIRSGQVRAVPGDQALSDVRHVVGR